MELALVMGVSVMVAGALIGMFQAHIQMLNQAAKEQFSGSGCTVYRAAADQDDRECRGLSDLRYGSGSQKRHRHAGVGRAGG